MGIGKDATFQCNWINASTCWLPVKNESVGSKRTIPEVATQWSDVAEGTNFITLAKGECVP